MREIFQYLPPAMKTDVMQAEAAPPEAPKGNRKQSTDCTDYTERTRAASNCRTWVERIVAGLAGTPHPGRRMWRNRPPRGRREPAAGRSSSPSTYGRFSKRTQMMALVEFENFDFPRKNDIPMSRSGQTKQFFYQTNPNDSAPPIGVSPVTTMPKERASPTAFSSRHRLVSAPLVVAAALRRVSSVAGRRRR